MNSSKKSSKKTSSKAPIAKLKELKEVVLKNDNDNEWNTEQTDEVIGKIEAVLKRNLLSVLFHNSFLLYLNFCHFSQLP